MGSIPPLILNLNFYEKSSFSNSSSFCGSSFKQEGVMKLAPERNWMPFCANQEMNALETEFCWKAKFKMAPLLFGTVVDAYRNGKGRLDAKLWGFLPVARGQGKEVDRAEIQRYLAEMVWCPMAFLENKALQFKQVADEIIRVWVFEESCSVDLLFDKDGDIVGVKTQARYRDQTTSQPWEGKFSNYQTLRKAGDFTLCGTFILGGEDQTLLQIKETVQFAIKLGLDYASFNPLVIHTKRLQEKTPSNLKAQQGSRILVESPTLSSKVLKQQVKKAYLQFYFRQSRLQKRFKQVRDFPDLLQFFREYFYYWKHTL